MSARIDGALSNFIQDILGDIFPGLTDAPASTSSPSTGDAGAAGDPEALFRQTFGDLAQDPEAFHATMRQVYGAGYDREAAEAMRQQALAGDYSWLPPVVYVGSDVLGGANGAYDAEAGVIYLNESLLSDPSLAAATFLEEAGHHIDTLVNGSDTAGDEGELFRRVLSGESLSANEIAAMRAENDHGTIVVNGKTVEVEFWNPFSAVADAVGDAVDAVGDAIGSAANAVAGAVSEVAGWVGDAIKGVGEGLLGFGETLVGGVASFFGGIGGGIVNFGKSLFQGDITGAFENLFHGLDKAFLQTPEKLFQGFLDATEDVVNGATELLGPLGGPIREVVSRGVDIVRTAGQVGVGIARDFVSIGIETPLDFLSDLGDAAGHLLKGEFGEAGKTFLGAFASAGGRIIGGVVDMAVRGLHGAADIVSTGLFLQQPSRGLTDEEKDFLRSVYGDSIDVDAIRVRRGGGTELFGAAPHTIGNTIHMREESDFGTDYFNEDGTLTEDGLILLAHEAAHVWQNQNGGGDYLHKSIGSQLAAWISGGDRNGAYEWESAFTAGVSFADMNPEQQAEIIEEIAGYIARSGSTNPADWSTARSADELAFMLDAWQQIQDGLSAP